MQYAIIIEGSTKIIMLFVIPFHYAQRYKILLLTSINKYPCRSRVCRVKISRPKGLIENSFLCIQEVFETENVPFSFSFTRKTSGSNNNNSNNNNNNNNDVKSSV